jgi:hypothetical protein
MDPRSIGAGQPAGSSRFSAMTPEERLQIFVELCDLTDSIVRNRPDADHLRAAAPLSAASEATWQRLVQEARRERERARR